MLIVWFGFLGPGFRDLVLGYPIFQGFNPPAQGVRGVLNPLLPSSQQTAWVKGGNLRPFQSSHFTSCNLNTTDVRNSAESTLV